MASNAKAAPKRSCGAYANRYGINGQRALEELMAIGYYDEILIQGYEKEGVKLEYMVEPLSGEMYVVPEGTDYHDLYHYHTIF